MNRGPRERNGKMNLDISQTTQARNTESDLFEMNLNMD